MMLRVTYVHKLVLVMAMLSVAGGVLAENSSRYVNDLLIITLRAGPGDEFRILKTLRTGDKMELLEEDEKFAKVITADGTEGWARKQYLSDTPVAKLLLESATQKVERFEQENKKLKVSLASLEEENTKLKQETDRLLKENRKLGQENTRIKVLSKRPIELDEENTKLKKESELIKEEIAHLRDRNRGLEQSTVQKWFMAGSGVLLLGIILGVVLPRLRSSRSSGWA